MRNASQPQLNSSLAPKHKDNAPNDILIRLREGDSD